MTHQVYLVPGFFGFANLGDINYFMHVRDCLTASFAERGESVDIHYVRTRPTASLPRRAARLLHAVAETAGDGDDPIHLFGHSTGGLDARLLASPGVTLPSEHDVEAYAARVRTVVAIATPHYGTPQAALFTSLLGQRLLRVLSLLTLHGIRLGSVPLTAVVALTGALAPSRRLQGPVLSILEQVYRQLLRDFDKERQRDIEEFFSDTTADQGLMPQLSPEGMDLFNAATSERPSVRYGSVVAQTRPPEWRTQVRIGLSPSAQALYALFRALHELAAAMPESALPRLTTAQADALVAAFGGLPGPQHNDAIVPALSQVFGDVVHASWADHLDVIGHFGDPTHDPPHVDWLGTRSGFDRRRFEALWADVAAYALAE